MKAIVIDKKHITLVSHTNGVTIVEESGCIIDLDFQSLGSIFELADLGNTYTIKDCDEIESLKSNNKLAEHIEFLEEQLAISCEAVTNLESANEAFKSNIVDKNNTIKRQSNEIARLSKIIEEKTNSLIKLENIEDALNSTVKVNA